MSDWSGGPYWVVVRIGALALASKACADPDAVIHALENPPPPPLVTTGLEQLLGGATLLIVCRHEKAQQELHPVLHEGGWCEKVDVVQEVAPQMN